MRSSGELDDVRLLDPINRCDARECGAQAFARAHLLGLQLHFCAHHFREYETKLRDSGAHIIDETRFVGR